MLKKKAYKKILIIISFFPIYIFQFYLSIKKFEKSNNKKKFSNNDKFSNYCIYEPIILKYKRSNIIWPLPKEIKYKPIMSEDELPIYKQI